MKQTSGWIIYLALILTQEPLQYARAIPIGDGYLQRTDVTHFLSAYVGSLTSTATYVCIYISQDLPKCGFQSNNDEEKSDTVPNISRSSTGHEEAPSRTKYAEGISQNNHVTIYSIEGCKPSRLPFNIPSCKKEDFPDKTVQIRKLYPFRISGLTEATVIFPEFNFDEWLRMMQRLRENQDSLLMKKKGATSSGNPEHPEVYRRTVGPITRSSILLQQRARLAGKNKEAQKGGDGDGDSAARDDFLFMEFRPLMGENIRGSYYRTNSERKEAKDTAGI
ncbi:uncharacterized protein [Prorops nasuta]|uniref:uncharacterized protein n=1 Tax=Prorops nasuta TaxID=863751 RepID=UPI0034CE3C85